MRVVGTVAVATERGSVTFARVLAEGVVGYEGNADVQIS